MVGLLGEDLPESIESPLPGGAPLTYPAFGAAQRGGFNVAGPRSADFLRTNQAARLQHLQVLNDGGQGHVERLRELSDRGGAAAQALDDQAPRRVRERLEDEIEPGQRHVVSHDA